MNIAVDPQEVITTQLGKVQIELPTLHDDQVKAYNLPGRFKAIRCGRRWGKTALLKTISCDFVLKGCRVGWFAPSYKYLSDVFNELEEILWPVITTSSRNTGVIRTQTRGSIECWTLEDERAGRSRKYHLAAIDEAAFAKPNATGIWEKAIRPTLLDYRGAAIVASNASGLDEENFFWRICNIPDYGFVQYHAPTRNNPFLPADELLRLKEQNHPLVYQQEYEAEFVDWAGTAFFELANMMEDGAPVDPPHQCAGVFAVMDTAVKSGKKNDGTGVILAAYEKLGDVHKIWILDYMLVQVDGAMLEQFVPLVEQDLEKHAEKCKARGGVLGIWVEDKQSGTILLQQLSKRSKKVFPLPQALSQLGKSERAVNISGYVYQKKVKITRQVYVKTSNYKGIHKNHFLAQILGFRVGDVEDREDDLLDAFCYAVTIALGGGDGF